MALSVSLTGDWLQNIGSVQQTVGSITFDDSYATGGESLTPAMVGLGEIIGLSIIQGEDGYVAKWDKANQKILLYRSAGFTPAGTNGTSAVTGNVTVVGGTLGEATGINPDSNAGVLSKAAATNRTIPIATYLGAAPTAGAQTFTGTAVAAGALVQVASGVDVSGVVINFIAIGR
jgi:hypothetical protein